MLKDKQVIIFDLDGTAIDSPNRRMPSTRLTEAVKDLKRICRVCVATGRPWAYARPVLRELGLTEPCVISSGTQICDPQTGQILWQNDMDPVAVESVMEVLKSRTAAGRYPECKILVNNFDEDSQLNGGISVQDFEVDEPVYLINVAYVPDAIVKDVLSELSSIGNISCTMVISQTPGVKDIHITTKDATKEYATMMLLEMIGLRSRAAVGVGDGYNDLHLFRAVEHRVAMGNAVEELKDRADEIIASVHEDGLALFFERLLGDY